jgi:hypothetical protein
MTRYLAAFSVAFLLAGLLGCSSHNGVLPQTLDDMESGTEDLIDLVNSGDIPGALNKAAEVQADWQVVRPEVARAGASKATIEGMDKAVGALVAPEIHDDPLAMERAANEVTRYMPGLFALYSTGVPPGTLKLDYLGRSLLLDANEQQMDRAARDLGEMQKAWGDLRPEIASRSGGDKVAAAYDLDLESVQAAIDASDASLLQDSAKRCLETVDLMEGLFDSTDKKD